jgi:hypothetical protein
MKRRGVAIISLDNLLFLVEGKNKWTSRENSSKVKVTDL